MKEYLEWLCDNRSEAFMRAPGGLKNAYWFKMDYVTEEGYRWGVKHVGTPFLEELSSGELFESVCREIQKEGWLWSIVYGTCEDYTFRIHRHPNEPYIEPVVASTMVEAALEAFVEALKKRVSVKCEVCQGQGDIVDGYGVYTCWKCGGLGEMVEICKMCMGDGQVSDFNSKLNPINIKTCPTCKGKKYLPVTSS